MAREADKGAQRPGPRSILLADRREGPGCVDAAAVAWALR